MCVLACVSLDVRVCVCVYLCSFMCVRVTKKVAIAPLIEPTAPSASTVLTIHVREGFFVFGSRLLGCHICGRQKNKKQKKHIDTESVLSWGATEHERGLTRTTHGKTTYWKQERVQFWGTSELEWVPYTHATWCTQRYKSPFAH